MQYMLKRAALAILGVVVMLAYWTVTGGGSNSEVQGIPAKVWEGGGGILGIEIDSTTAAKFRISFNDDSDKSLETWTPVTAGSHHFAIDIPHQAGGYIEFGADDPKVGDKLSWKISLNGETVDEQEDTLDEPLPNGYAFFLQSYYDDYSTMTVEED